MKIVVFTGAGISRESGIKTFRDSKDGLWEDHDIRVVASIEGWWTDRETVLNFYNQRRREVLGCKPNAAHFLLASLEDRHEVLIVTQNIDDLHERAGSSHVIHLHGEILKAMGEDGGSTPIPWLEDIKLGDLDQYGSQLRPQIVWFGEGLPEFERAYRLATRDDVDVSIIVGSTLSVYPAASIATDSNAKKVFLIDPDPPKLIRRNTTVIAKVATEGVSEVVEILMKETR